MWGIVQRPEGVSSGFGEGRSPPGEAVWRLQGYAYYTEIFCRCYKFVIKICMLAERCHADIVDVPPGC